MKPQQSSLVSKSGGREWEEQGWSIKWLVPCSETGLYPAPLLEGEPQSPGLAPGDPSAAQSKARLAFRAEGSKACDRCCGSLRSGGPALQRASSAHFCTRKCFSHQDPLPAKTFGLEHQALVGSFEDVNGDLEFNFPGLWETRKEDGEL